MCDQGLTQNPYSSLRSKRFCWLFCTFEAFFALWPIENWGKAEKQSASKVRKNLRKRLLRRLSLFLPILGQTDIIFHIIFWTKRL